ncbi:MAG: sugar ABC transporter permease [Geminicoccaceae bacterium]|nr:sugar ABC transporter permease [Geminicoccaceae bacterium]
MATATVPISANKVWVFYAFALPFALLTIIFGLWPIVLSFDVSLTKSATALRPEPDYVGLANYAKVLSDPTFIRSLIATLFYTAIAVIANLAFALVYALLLNSTAIGPGKTFFKVAMFLPVVTPDLAGYVVWRWLYDQSFGAVNAFLKLVGLPAFGGIASPDTAVIAILIAELWHHAGFYVLIFLANLAICDRALEEAASIDGANRWQQFRFVTWPSISQLYLTCLLLSTIWTLGDFNSVYLLTGGGPADLTHVLSTLGIRYLRLAEVDMSMATIVTALPLILPLVYFMMKRLSR